MSALRDQADSGELTLSLTDPTYLFNAPRIEPLSPSPVEVLGISGFNYLVDQTFMTRPAQRPKTLVLVLPPEKFASVGSEQLIRAIRRHAQSRIEQLRRELRDTYRYGWRAAGAALIVLAMCLGMAQFFASDLTARMRPLLRTTFEYGFEIIGWVILWHPVDVLVFTPVPMRWRIKALQTLATVTVIIRAEPTPETRNAET